MANELPNAVTLRRDSDFRDWLVAAIGYQARIVLGEASTTPDYAARRRMASAAILDPAQPQIADRFVNVLATDPEVASKGPTVELVTQATILAKVAFYWGPLAVLLYAS